MVVGAKAEEEGVDVVEAKAEEDLEEEAEAGAEAKEAVAPQPLTPMTLAGATILWNGGPCQQKNKLDAGLPELKPLPQVELDQGQQEQLEQMQQLQLQHQPTQEAMGLAEAEIAELFAQ